MLTLSPFRYTYDLDGTGGPVADGTDGDGTDGDGTDGDGEW